VPNPPAGTCDNTTTRNLGVNANASPATQVYLQETWARPNLINALGATTIDPAIGNATYSGAPAPSYFSTLEAMTSDMTTGRRTSPTMQTMMAPWAPWAPWASWASFRWAKDS
jgi:hypothetical protein